MGQLELSDTVHICSLPGANNLIKVDSGNYTISDAIIHLDDTTGLLKKVQFKPTGSIVISGSSNHDTYQQYPYVFSLSGNLSQSFLGVPLSIVTGINSYGIAASQTQSTFAISFDRYLFLDRVRKMILQKQQEKYQSAFDSLQQIIVRFNSFDSIRKLINDEKLLANVHAAYFLIDSLNGTKIDSSFAKVTAIQFDSSVLVTSKKIIGQYLELQHTYGELFAFQKKILSEYQTLDLSKITSSFALPISPDQLTEEQLLNEAKGYGINQLNQLLSGLKQFTIGETLLSQSPLTLSNKIASGCSFSYNFRSVYFGATLAREKMNAVPYSGSGTVFKQFTNTKQFNIISQVLLGAGSRDREFVEASATQFNFNDQADHSSSAIITPFKNTLASLSAGAADPSGFRTIAEVTGSANSYLPSGLITETTANTKLSQHIGYHFQIEKQIPKTGSSFNLEYISTGALYKTYGNNHLVSDSRSVKGALSQSMFRSRFTFSGSCYWMRYNVSSWFQLPFFQLNYSGEVKYNIRNGSALFRYNPVISSSPGNIQKNEIHMIQFQFSKNYTLLKIPVSTLICLYSTKIEGGYNADTLKTPNSNFLRGDYQQRISITPKFSMQTLVSVQSPEKTPAAITYYMVEINGNWQAGTKGMLSLNLCMNGFEDSKYLGTGITSTWNILKNSMVSFHGDIRMSTSPVHRLKTVVYHASISFSQSF